MKRGIQQSSNVATYVMLSVAMLQRRTGCSGSLGQWVARAQCPFRTSWGSDGEAEACGMDRNGRALSEIQGRENKQWVIETGAFAGGGPVVRLTPTYSR